MNEGVVAWWRGGGGMGTETAAYRIQSATRPVESLLDPGQQYSFPMDEDDETVRHGVSGCLTLADLAAYLACYAISAPAPAPARIAGPRPRTPLGMRRAGRSCTSPPAPRWSGMAPRSSSRWAPWSTCAGSRGSTARPCATSPLSDSEPLPSLGWGRAGQVLTYSATRHKSPTRSGLHSLRMTAYT